MGYSKNSLKHKLKTESNEKEYIARELTDHEKQNDRTIIYNDNQRTLKRTFNEQ